MRIVEQLRLAVGADLINLAVGIGGGVDLVLESEHEGVDLQAIQFGEGAALSAAIDHEHLGRSAAGAAARGVEVALGVRGKGPQIGRGGIEDLGELGRQKDAAVGAQRKMLQGSVFEIGAVAVLPEVGVDGEAGAKGGEGHHGRILRIFIYQVLTYVSISR